MTCSACSKPNLDGVSFCEFCGADMRSSATFNSRPVTAHVANAQPQMPSAADVAQMGKTLLNSMTLGEKFVGAGAAAAIVGFFLPWISGPDLGPFGSLLGSMASSGLANVRLSGVDLARVIGVVYFILLAAITSGVLFYLSKKSLAGQKLLVAGFQIMIGSMFGPSMIGVLFFVPMIQSVAGAGFWLLGIGFTCIAAGGLVTIASLRKVAN